MNTKSTNDSAPILPKHLKAFGRREIPPLLFTDSAMPAFLGDLYKGYSAFLIGGGPSFQRIDHTCLRKPGILTMAMNNASKTFRPSLWTCVDRPSTFIKSVWLDPTITKFVPQSFANSYIDDDQPEEALGIRVCDCPNVFFFMRHLGFESENYLDQPTICWGNAEKNGGGRSVMLVALRLLFYLGVRNVYLLGIDFEMVEENPYHFDETVNERFIKGNNSTYSKLINWLSELKPHFEENEFYVWNLNPASRLTVFPMIGLENAIKTALDEIPDPNFEETRGRYSSKDGLSLPRRKWNAHPEGIIQEKLDIQICVFLYRFHLRFRWMLSSLVQQNAKDNSSGTPQIGVRVSILKEDPEYELIEELTQTFAPLIDLEVIEFSGKRAADRGLIRDVDIAESKGEWVLFSDADLVFHPQFFSRAWPDVSNTTDSGNLLTIPRWNTSLMDGNCLADAASPPLCLMDDAYYKCSKHRSEMALGGAAPGAGYFQLVQLKWLHEQGLNYSSGNTDRTLHHEEGHKNYSDVRFRKKMNDIVRFRFESEVGPEIGWKDVIHLEHVRQRDVAGEVPLR